MSGWIVITSGSTFISAGVSFPLSDTIFPASGFCTLCSRLTCWSAFIVMAAGVCSVGADRVSTLLKFPSCSGTRGAATWFTPSLFSAFISAGAVFSGL